MAVGMRTGLGAAAHLALAVRVCVRDGCVRGS